MKKKSMKKNMDMSNNNDYTTGNLLDYPYFKKHYKLIAIDCNCKQTKLKDPQQINFIGKLLKHTGATMFFIVEIRRNYFWIFTKFCKYFIKNGDAKDCSKFIK